MADLHNEEEKKGESVMEKIADDNHGKDSSSSSSLSSSDSEDEKKSSLKANVCRLFGREKPVHLLLGGGKRWDMKGIRRKTCNFVFCMNAADVLLWRDKKVSAGVVGGATAIWVLFHVLEYHLLSFICHGLIFGLVILFLFSNASAFIKKIPPCIPKIKIPEEPVLNFASALRLHFNQAFAALRDIATGNDIKKFLSVIAGLWIFSLLGSCCDFLTLLYTITVLLFTVPISYEKYEDQVDSCAHKAMAELKKQYAALDARVLSKIPRGPLKNKKSD